LSSPQCAGVTAMIFKVNEKKIINREFLEGIEAEWGNIINAITGWDFTPEDFIKVGERINNIQHIINLKRGLSRDQMTYPKRLKEALPNGGTEGNLPDFEKMVDEYLTIRKWDKNAIPFKEKLEELGLSDYLISEMACDYYKA
jgi:aldehyde:ferredoxin oxidoreductase